MDFMNDDQIKTENIGVPVRKKMTIFYIIMLIIGGTCITVGLGLFASLIGLISNRISSLFFVNMGWSAELTYVIFGSLGLLIGILIVSYAGRLNNLINRIIISMKSVEKDNSPRTYISLKDIPYTYKVFSLEKDHNCKIYKSNDGKSLRIQCDDLDEYGFKYININKQKRIRKVIEFFVVIVIPLLFMVTAYEGWWMDTPSKSIILILVLGLCIYFGIELETIPMWVSVIIIWIYMIFFYILLIDLITFEYYWTYVGIAFVYTLITGIISVIKPNICELNPHLAFCNFK